MALRQVDLDRYLTIQLQEKEDLITYSDNVMCWLGDILFFENQDGKIEQFQKAIKNCYFASISTLDCSRYLVDKFFDKQNSPKIKLFCNFDKLITGKTLFKEILSRKDFVLSAKMTGEYVMLKALDRTRSHRGINSYEFRKVHYSNLNFEYLVIRY